MAIWEKLFSKITFKDYPDTSTPLNASNMNALSNAIDGIDDRVVELNSNLDKKQNYISIGVFTGNIDMITADGSNNTLPQNSIAWVHNTDATGNHPTEYYVLETFVALTGINIQRATQYIGQGAPIVYTRMYVNEEWSSWFNSDLNWKLIARVEGSNPINLAPYKNIAREFRFVAVYEYGNTHWKVPITASHTDVYDDILYQYLYGGASYGNANGVGASIGIDTGGGNVILKDFYFNGNIELGVATALFAYYR